MKLLVLFLRRNIESLTWFAILVAASIAIMCSVQILIMQKGIQLQLVSTTGQEVGTIELRKESLLSTLEEVGYEGKDELPLTIVYPIDKMEVGYTRLKKDSLKLIIVKK